MKRMTAAIGALAAVVLMTAGVLAQAKPNFAGTWTMDAPAAPAAPPAGAPAGGGGGGGRGGGRGGGGWGMEITIAQTAATLNVKGMQGQNPLDLTYKLDGSESKNMMAGRGGGAPTEQVSKAAWTGDKLTITTTVQGPNGPTEQTRTLSLVAGKLSIDTANAGGTPTTVTYSKK